MNRGCILIKTDSKTYVRTLPETIKFTAVDAELSQIHVLNLRLHAFWCIKCQSFIPVARSDRLRLPNRHGVNHQCSKSIKSTNERSSIASSPSMTTVSSAAETPSVQSNPVAMSISTNTTNSSVPASQSIPSISTTAGTSSLQSDPAMSISSTASPMVATQSPASSMASSSAPQIESPMTILIEPSMATHMEPSIAPTMASSTPSIYPDLSDFETDYELVHESWPILDNETNEIEDREILINMDFSNSKQIQSCKYKYSTTFKYEENPIAIDIYCNEKFNDDNEFKYHKETCIFRIGLVVFNMY